MSQLFFACPVCGADVPRQAKSCPECGACEKSGWSEDQYLDGIDLPDEDDFTARRLGDGSGRGNPPGTLPRVWMVAAVIVLIAMVLLTIQAAWHGVP